MKEKIQTGAFKAGVLYLIAELVTRGISFLVTPIFTRLLPDIVYADVKVFEAWTYLFAPVISLSIYQSVARAKFDFKNNYYKYISCMLGFMVTATVIIGFIGYFLRNILAGILGFSPDLMLLMLIYCLAYNSIQCIQMGERQLLHYKSNILLTILAVVPSVVISVYFVISYRNILNLQQLLQLRLFSFYIPVIIIGLIVILISLLHGRKFYNGVYWNYGLRYSIPLIFFSLSTQVLYQSDKIMVKYLCNASVTAILALATTVGYIMDILVHAIDNAWRPWLFEKLHSESYEEIQKIWFALLSAICILSWCMVLLAPELVMFLGGSNYKEATWLIAPIVCGALANFIMIGYIALEQYAKQTKLSGIINVILAFLNIGLNYFFIQLFDYRATAYTTVFCYLVAGVLHCIFVVKHYKLTLFNPTKTFAMCGGTFLISFLTMFTYKFPSVIRIVGMSALLLFLGLVYKDAIEKSIISLKKKK